MPAESDPRVFFAAERTLLAWLRTGIAVVGLGFLVARFGFFLTIISGRDGYRYQPISTAIGVGLVLVGTLLVTVAAWQQRRFVKSLPPGDLPAGYSTRLSIWLSLLLALAGLVLAVYLTVSSEHTHLPQPPTVVGAAVASDGSLSLSQRRAAAELVRLTAERLSLMEQVARYKWNHKLPIENSQREAELLAELVEQGTAAGVSDAVVARFFENQFAAAKAMQQRYFTEWKSQAVGTFDDVPDLTTQVRPQIDRISAEMIERLEVLKAVWEHAALQREMQRAIETSGDERIQLVRAAVGIKR